MLDVESKQMLENWLSTHTLLITPIVQLLLVLEPFLTAILLTIKNWLNWYQSPNASDQTNLY